MPSRDPTAPKPADAMAPEMHILQVFHAWEAGEHAGVLSVMQDLIRSLGHRHRLSVLVDSWQNPRVGSARDAEGRTYWLLRLVPPPRPGTPLTGWLALPMRRLLAAWRLRTLCRREGVDVIHLHYASPNFITVALARALGGPPYLITCHRGDVLGYPSLSARQQRAMRAAMQQAAAVTAVSSWLARIAQETLGLGRPVLTIHNGYTPDPEPPMNGAEVERHIGRTLPRQFAVLVANCRPYKGHDIALEAWRLLAGELPELALVVVGGGPDLADCKALAERLGVTDRVWFLGPQPREVALGLIANAELMVAPSRSEGFAIAILEAASLATPIVCSDIPPFLEIATDGETAHVFPVDDAAAMAAAVRRSVDDPETARTMAARLQQHAESEHSVQAMASSYETLYARLSAGG